MKKRIGLIAVIVIVLLVLLVLCFPIPRDPCNDGGTRTYDALIYKVVHWNRIHITMDENGQDNGDPIYRKTSVFFFPNNLKSIDALWEMEMAKEKKEVSDDTQQFVFHSSDEFAKYLDEVNFVAGLSQRDFISQVEKYSYNQTPILGSHYDGLLGGGWSAGGAEYGFANDYKLTEDKEYANYLNSLYTTVKLDGLELPFGIDFDDTITTALQKLGIDMDLQDDLSEMGTMILYRDDRSSFQLTNSTMPAIRQCDCVLTYTENYQYTMKDGRDSDVTRQIVLAFSNDSDKLGFFKISVNEKFKFS